MTATTSFLKGRMATASIFNASNSVLSLAGMAIPAGLGVVENSNRLLVTPHSGVFGCGVTHTEDSTRYIDTTKFFNIGSNPYEGTILYRLDPSLDFQPTLGIEAGHLSTNPNPYVLVLGWISYPGNDAGLSDGQLYSAQTASSFRYSYFANPRDILSLLPVRYDPPINTVVDTWYATSHPEFSLRLVVENVTTNVRITTQDINNESWLVLSNTGSTTQDFVFEAIAHNDAESATSLHTRIMMDIGVVINTGIMYRGLIGERTLSSGTISGPTDKGTFSVSLIEAKTPAQGSFKIRYHVTLPGLKQFGISSLGVANTAFFGNMFVPD